MGKSFCWNWENQGIGDGGGHLTQNKIMVKMCIFKSFQAFFSNCFYLPILQPPLTNREGEKSESVNQFKKIREVVLNYRCFIKKFSKLILTNRS